MFQHVTKINIFKLFEKPLFNCISSFFDQIFFSIHQCGFRKGFSAKHCLVAMLEKWKACNDKGNSFGSLLTDLSKAFDCLSRDLLIAKLDAYGFSPPALKLVHIYLNNQGWRIRRTAEAMTPPPPPTFLKKLLFFNKFHTIMANCEPYPLSPLHLNFAPPPLIIEHKGRR